MARTVDTINTQITAQLVTNFAAVGITIDPSQWSTRNIMRLFCYTFAICTAYLEQLMDAMKVNIETIAAKTAAASGLWIQAKMLLFQYSTTNPQYVQLIDTVPQYATVDETLRIIKACSVTSIVANEVKVKVATLNGSKLEAIDTDQLIAAQNYIDTIGTAGTQYFVISQEPDLIYINANVYYTGQFATVKAAVVAALVNYLQTLSITNFDGSVKVTDIEKTIRAVGGVNDVELINVKGRGVGTSFASGAYLVQNKTTVLRLYKTDAGYCDQDVYPNNFETTINFISE